MLDSYISAPLRLWHCQVTNDEICTQGTPPARGKNPAGSKKKRPCRAINPTSAMQRTLLVSFFSSATLATVIFWQ